MAHYYARFFSLPQSAVLAMELLKAKGEPTPMLYGWGGALLVIDQLNAQDCFFDLVDFAKNQWSDMYNDLDGKRKRLPRHRTCPSSQWPEAG